MGNLWASSYSYFTFLQLETALLAYVRAIFTLPFVHHYLTRMLCGEPRRTSSYLLVLGRLLRLQQTRRDHVSAFTSGTVPVAALNQVVPTNAFEWVSSGRTENVLERSGAFYMLYAIPPRSSSALTVRSSSECMPPRSSR
ncbi:hypothetical protein BD414DRAFT_286778 [Trametes punicea]|nr:hypothetical protein BD414DRAFT_286778 [Trametes punicea]